jgi:hypothetical protein
LAYYRTDIIHAAKLLDVFHTEWRSMILFIMTDGKGKLQVTFKELQLVLNRLLSQDSFVYGEKCISLIYAYKNTSILP